MPKQLNVNLGFTADTSQAKAQLQDLQKQLTNLINNPKSMNSLGITKEIQEASVAVATLKTQLENATNVNTGKLDLGRFNQSLKESGYQIKDYKNALLALGPEGQKAFAALAQSITTAEVPLRRSNALLREFSTSLKNTARWQISSSVVHGFMGAIQSAYGYAQDLNESLNNIRIVTGQSVDEMAKFAEKANASAKALSTTTTAYTDAALIFYQQGLSGKEVTERTDTVIKMANVTRDSAEEVSSYMTAIWNNFYDGSASLEHYADVITALGAATASSSSEISEGLSKFASVADTIGLSYDYATSILAALVANTRQSADVIGTSLKTILARLQSVKLGETLEDGVELTKYTSALNAIGVSVLDLNGNLRDADDILDDTAAKWDTLTKAQQASVAQTVAGTRQYSQFIAMMANWGDVEKNLGTASAAEGTLQDQADIYAESWEAASKRVKASAQNIYDTLLNDKFFIELNNAFADILDTINNTIEGLGGLKGVLLAVGSIFLKVYSNQAVEALKNVQYSFMMMSDTGSKKLEELRAKTNEELKTLFSDEASVSGNMMGEAYASQAQVQGELLEKAKGMTEEQKKIAQLFLDQHTTLVQMVAEQQKLVEKAEEEANISKMKGNSSTSKVGINKSQIDEFAKLTKEANTFEATIEKAFGKFDSSKIKTQVEQLKTQIKSLRGVFKENEEISDAFGEKGKEAFINLEKAANDASTSPEDLANKLLDLYDAIEKAQNKAQGFGDELRELANDSRAPEEEIQKATNAINNIERTSTAAGQELGNMAGQMVNVETSASGFGKKLDKIPNATNKALTGLVGLAQTFSTVGMAITSITGLIDTWNNEDLSGGEKLLATITTLGFVIPSVISAFQGLKIEQVAVLAQSIAVAFGFTGEAQAAVAAGTATAGFGTVLYTVLWPIGLAVLAIGALVAIIYGLVKAFEAVQAATPDGVLKSAKEAANEAADAARDAAQAYQDVKSALDDLDSSISAIESLERGTLEWKQAILESNDALIELLSTYGMLSSENFTTNADGLMEITDDARESILEQAAAKSSKASNASYAAQVRVNNAENRVNASDAAAAITVMRSSGDAAYDAVTSNSQLSADIGMAIADALGSGTLNTDDLIEGSDRLVGILDRNANVTADEAKSIAEQIANNDELIQGMSELATEVAANTEANRILNNQIVESNFGSDIDKSGLSEDNQEYLKNMMGSDLEELTNELYESTWKDKFGGKWDSEIQEKYAEAMGYATDTIENMNDNKAKYYKEDGTEVGVISDETARRYLAQQEAIAQMQGDVQGYIDTMNQLIQTGNQIADGVGDAMASFAGGNGGDLSNLSKNERDAFENSISEYDSDNDTFNIGDAVIDQAAAEDLGYKTVEEYYNAIQNAINAYDSKLADVGKDVLSKAAVSAFESIDSKGDASLAGQQALSNIIEGAFVASGREGAQAVADLIDDNVSNIDDFTTAISGIDWETTSVEQLKNTLKQAGVETDFTDDELRQFINTMQTSQIAVEDATEGYNALHGVIDGLKNGDTISAEDYEALGAGYESFFMKMADGTYKLITDAQTFYDMVNGKSLEGFQNNVDRITALQNSGYDIETLSQSAMTGNTNADGVQTFTGSQARTQVDFLEAIGYDPQKIAEWKDALESGENLTVSMINSIGEAVNENAASWNTLDSMLEENQEQIASTARNLDELHYMLETDQISAEAFTKAAVAMDSASDLEGLDTEELQNYADYLREAAENMDDFNNSMTAEQSRVVAKGIMKMNDAIDTLADNFKDWRNILEKSAKDSEEFADAMMSTKGAVADLLDVSQDFVSNDFIADHLDEIAKAATGDAEAIDNLKAALLDDIVAHIVVENDLETVGYDLAAGVADLQSMLDSMGDLTIGTTIEDTDFINKCNELINSAGLTADQVNALFDAMGFETTFATDEIPVEKTGHQVITTTEVKDWIDVPANDGQSSYKIPGTIATETTQGKPYTYTEYVEAIAMESSPVGKGGQVPKISGITKKASGSANNYSSSNSGGKSPGKSSGGGGKKGGRGKKGGGGKTPEHKTKEKVDKFEADPFHKVNQELEDIEHNLKMIDKQQSHVFGKELINNLKQQNAQLKKQNKLHKHKLNIAKKEAKILRNKLKAEGVAFDGDNIANYNAMLRAAEKQINALIKQYNSLSAAKQEAYDNAYKEKKSPIEKAEEYYEKLKEQMDKYTDYMSTVYSEEEAMQDALFQRIENNLKAYQVKIEVKLDMSEARRAMNKFLKDMSTDIKNMYKTSAEWATIFKTSEKDAKADKDDINTKLKQLEAYKNASVGGAKDMFATKSEKYKAITDLEKEILEDSENLLNEYQTAYDNLRDAFGEVADQFNEILDQFDSINDTLDHYAKVIELLYGGETDNGREQLAELYSLQKENSLARQDAMRKWGDELLKRRADAIANGYDKDDSYIKDIDAQIEKNNKDLESEIENYIDTIQRELENSIKMAQSQMDKSIWGASMADVRQEWDDKKAMADGYYDSVERIYQLESLESKWKAAITNTKSLKAQQQLAAIMDKQVASLENKNTLSEKDIELAEKELTVYQAQIALEEAQNNKNSMKLTRDETGNWSYQYVADEDDIADKQQNYLDKVNEWRTASINAAEEITEKTMDAYEAFSERMTEIMNDVTLSEEERDAKIAELNATYWGEDGIITKLVEDSNYVQDVANRATYTELWSLYEQDTEKYKTMTETEKGLIDAMVRDGVTSYEGLRRHVIGDDGESGIYGEIYDLCKRTNEASSGAWKSMAADAINRMYKDPDSVSKTVKQAYVDMEGALKIYNKAIKNSEKASGVEWSKVGLQLDGVQKKIKETAKRVDDFTSKLKALSAFEKAVLRIKETWDKTSGSIKKATSDLEKYYKLLAKGKSKSTGSKSNSTSGGGKGTGDKSNSTGGGENGNTGGRGAGSGSGGDGKLTVGETVTYTGGTYYYDSYGTSPAGRRGAGKKVKVTSIKEDGRPYPIHVTSKDSAYGWLTKGQLSGYDTGGYTGDWAGGDGRLALLHSKELVLNKDDTKNILDTVQILRQFATKDLAQLVGDAISHGLSSLIGKALNFDSNNYDTTQVNNNTNEEQNVTINVEAVFPHADDINEIREAILSLPNYASQFKMRK